MLGEGDRTVTRRMLAGLVAACILLAALGIVALASARSHASASVRILSPRSEAQLPAAPLWVRFSTARGRLRAVTLNGLLITSQFDEPRAGYWELQVSPNYGLRHGTNVLSVTVSGAGGARFTRTVRFTAADNRPLAAAGRDELVGLGTTVRLSGLHSVGHPLGAGASGLRYRWRVIHTPPASAIAGSPDGTPETADEGPGDASGPAELSGAHTATPTIETDEPGIYALRLTVTAPDGTTGSDIVSVRADPPPLVPINTMALDPDGSGARGILVGDRFVKSAPDKWLQVAVFKRDTLEYMQNLSHEYDCPQATASPFAGGASFLVSCFNAVRTDLDRLDDSYLVVAVNQRSAAASSVQPPVGVSSALQRIGITPIAYRGNLNAKMLRGTYSVIGIPAAAVGTATQNAGGPLGAQQPGDGEITGYFVRNNKNLYGYSTSDRIAFDTQAPGSTVCDGCSTTTNVVQVGAQRASVTPGACCGWFHVVVLDRRNLAVKSNNAFYPTDVNNLVSMRDTLKAANDAGNQLVIITSRGFSGKVNAQFTNAENQAVAGLVDQIENVGGTRTRFFNALNNTPAQQSYTLIGGSNLGAARGLEAVASGATRGGFNTTPLQGTLARDNNWNYQVQETEAAGLPENVGTRVTNAMNQAPTLWPEQGNAGRTAAIRWIGQHVPLLDSQDPRAQYYTIPYTLGTWEGIRKNIMDTKLVPYDAGHGFSEADLTWARGELDKEIDWLEAVNDKMRVVAQPFADTGLAQWASLQQIAHRVNDVVKVADQRSQQSIKRYFEGVNDILKELPFEVGALIGALEAEYQTFADLVEINQGGETESAAAVYQAKTDDLGTELAARLDEVRKFLSRQAPEVISADYGKLKLVGSCFRGIGCPDPVSEWQITNADLNKAAQVLQAGAEASFWGGLLGAKYTAYDLLPYSHYTTPGKRYITGAFFDLRCPFMGSPASSIVARPIQLDLSQVPDTAKNTTDIWAMGFLTGKGTLTDGYVMNVPGIDSATGTPITDRVFGAVDPAGDLAKGGLGVYPEGFFRNYFTIHGLDHYPLADSPGGRWRDDEGACTG